MLCPSLQFFTRGAANVCGVVQVVNESFVDEAVISEVEDRLMPRTEELPIYTMQEFNNKVIPRCFFDFTKISFLKSFRWYGQAIDDVDK